MEADDDMIVVIVGDEDESVQDSKSVPIKQEIKHEVVDFEDVLETIEKYGQVVDVGVNVKAELLEESDYIENPDDEDYVPDNEDYMQDEDDEYIFADEEYEVEVVPKRKNTDNTHWRRRMKTDKERKSYVQELIDEFPELADDEELLIATVCEIMKSIKVPEPPKDYYVVNDIMLECIKCGTLSDTESAAARHYQEKHGTRYLVCYACGADFRSTTNLYKHEKRCTAPHATIVLKARAMYVGKKGRSRPFLLSPSELAKRKQPYKPKPRLFPCPQCSAVFASKPTLQSHLYKHSGKRPFQCDKCPAAYTSATALGRHAVVHAGLKFICDHCNRTFKTKATIIAHMDTHLPQKKYACEECGRRYAQRMALRLHVNRTHRHLPPPCACRLCPRRYPRMSILKSHMLKEHGMLLMTRNMFFKRLPTMSETELKQAKVVFKSEVDGISDPNDNMHNVNTEKIIQAEKNYVSDNDNSETEDNNIPDKQGPGFSPEVLEYIQKIQAEDTEYKDVKVVIIQNGKMVNIDGSEIEAQEVPVTFATESVVSANNEEEHVTESGKNNNEKPNDKRKQTFETKVEISPMEKYEQESDQGDMITRTRNKKNKANNDGVLKKGSKKSMPTL